VIELTVSDAAVVFSIVEALSGPLDDATYVKVLQEARFVLPKIVEAFDKAGLSVLDVDLPKIPLIAPGSKHHC